MTLSINSQTRFVSIDFETTGLDTTKDEPIQVGVVITDANFCIVDVYTQLIKPEKNIKELKHVVGYITGLDFKQLEGSPSKHFVGEQLWTLLRPDDIIIGHNVQFDLAILKQCIDKEFVHFVDTFSLSQTLVHYPPSYALEVLCDIDAIKTEVGILELELQKRSFGLAGSHDALHDSVKTLGLFRYLLKRIIKLSEHYPGLATVIQQSDLLSFFDGNDTGTLHMPVLQKPVARPKTKVEPHSPITFDLSTAASASSRYCGHQPLDSLLGLIVHNEPCILAFHTRQKVEFVKALLDRKGYNDVGFAKPEQYIDNRILNTLAHRDDLSEREISFLIMYLSHHHQGLRVLDLHSKDDYSIFGLVKKEGETVMATRMLCTHGGLYSLLDDQRYQNHRIFFLDSDWRHYSYNGYHSQTLNLDYVVDLIDAAHYRYARLMELGHDHSDQGIIDSLHGLKQCFLVFLGSLGIEITKHFIGKPNKKLELGPILHDSSFFQTQQLRPKLAKLFHKTIQLIDSDAHYQLVHEYEKLLTIVDHVVVVEKTMMDNRYLHYNFCLANTYIDFQEFKSLFENRFVLFLSNQRDSFPTFGAAVSVSSHINKKVVVCKDMQKIAHSLIEGSIEGDCVFILSNIKEESRGFFESYSQGILSEYMFFVENINGGVGKITYLVQSVPGKKIIIGGYYFLLHLFAKMVKLHTIVIYNASGPMEKVVLADIAYYGQARD